MKEILSQVFSPALIGAFVTLGLGWAIAVILSKIASRIISGQKTVPHVLRWLAFKDPQPSGSGGPPSLEPSPQSVAKWTANAVYYVVMAFVGATFFHLLAKTSMLEPLNLVLTPLVAYIPKLINAVVLLIVALVVASVLKRITEGGLRLARIDQRLGETLDETKDPTPTLSSLIACVVYWCVVVFFLPAIASPFGLPDLLEPLARITDRIFEFIPNIVASLVILFVGHFVAGILRRLLASAFSRAGLDAMTNHWCKLAGMGDTTLSKLLSRSFYLLFLMALWVAALEALRLEAIYTPAADMLSKVTGILPKLLGATIVVVVAIILGRILGELATNLLTGFGLNALWTKVGFAKELPESGSGPAKVAGHLLFISVVGLAIAESASILGFEVVPAVLSNLVVSAGHIIFGIAIFAAGILIARWAGKTVQESQLPRAAALAVASRVAIIVLAVATSLYQMHVANEIVTVGFALALGSIGVAFALAFGIGGREAASRFLAEWRSDGNDRQ